MNSVSNLFKNIFFFSLAIFLLTGCSDSKEDSLICITALDCPDGQICIDGACKDGTAGDTGNTGNTGNTGDTGNTGNTGNTGDTGNTGNTGDSEETDNTPDTDDIYSNDDISDQTNDSNDNDEDLDSYESDVDNDEDVYVPVCGNGIEEDKGAAFSGEIVLFYLNEGTGLIATDSSGTGNNGTIAGATWVDGKFGKGLQFNGTADNHISLAYTPSTNNFTMMAWIKTELTHEIDPQTDNTTTGTLGQNYIFGADNKDTDGGAGISVGTNGISVYEHGNGYMPALAVYNGTVGSGWSHVAVTYTDKQPRIYLNGILVKTGLTSPKTTVYAPTMIGAGAYGSFNGIMDHVRIFNRPLSEAEIISAMGERCDDGALNGTTGKCKIDCSGYECTPGTVNFDYTGAAQTWIVPTGVTNIQIEVWGAQGGPGATNGTALGGLGGYAKGNFAATPGQTLYIYIGQGNVYSTGAITPSFNGGGAGRGNAADNVRGNGGGASDVRAGGSALGNRVIVAGGGGGSSGSDFLGGAGGGISGNDGSGAIPGTGATQYAGGISASGFEMTDGSLGLGGGMISTTYTLAGGGGGYYGGGGGLSAGGGSGYIGGVSAGSMSSGVRTGNGTAVITIICP